MKHHTTVNADLKLYNANTRGKDVGDCVKRALCMGFAMDYDEVSKELNRIKRDKGLSSYNIEPVYKEFVNRRNCKFKVVDGESTVEEFCNSDFFSKGTYILEVGKPEGEIATHLCCVIDGDLYDSWNSLGWKIYKFCTVTRQESTVYDLEIDDIVQDMQEDIEYYMDRLFDRLNIDYATYSTSYTKELNRINNYTCEYIVIIKFQKELPRYSKYKYMNGRGYGHVLTLKLNPRFDQDQNRKIIFKKLKQKIYDWIYNIVREIKDAKEAEDTDFSNAVYLSDEEKKFVMHLPQWVRNRIIDIEFGDGDYSDKYKVYFEALPDDPYLADRGSEVMTVADSLRDLKYNIEDYKKNYSRFMYDY